MRFLLLLPALLAAGTASARDWNVDFDNSSIMFEFTQLGSAVEGKFDLFGTRISFDPDDLASASIVAEIDTTTFNSGNAQRDQGVAGADWLASSTFPTARFESTAVSLRDDGAYDIKGNLTIRDVSVAITLVSEIEIDGDQASATGQVELNRRDFSVGQGEFDDEKAVGLAVPVTVRIEATAAD